MARQDQVMCMGSERNEERGEMRAVGIPRLGRTMARRTDGKNMFERISRGDGVVCG